MVGAAGSRTLSNPKRRFMSFSASGSAAWGLAFRYQAHFSASCSGLKSTSSSVCWIPQARGRIFASIFMPGAQLIELAPSILSADFAHLAEQIQAAADGGGSLIHVDVMDGHFVPNITIGPPVVRAIKRVAKVPLDVHLMISDPERY